ncbi:lysozyme-like domain containing protein [Marinobacter sp. CHS3-4]|uniref:transglycosylase SLT domain-containing protein n=1 Tax=Marinobacter sp. CHS3-4 TaxID=3045174 RepID=UPI0024B59686|nr:lysozyme-like domain containing protein [Marinobacter sp. CHS3-4]MDI9244770.1 lysozyme-like domain containing protein [Marinobacter sp. CHS3-4]
MVKQRKRHWLSATWSSRLTWVVLPATGVIITILITIRFSLLEPDSPADPDNICSVFREHPVWYDYAKDAQQKWGTPIATQLAFVYYESSFRSHARPPRKLLLGFIPWLRPTSAFGYAQALDPAWGEYLEANGDGLAVVRTNMKYALDFVGWYNHLTRREVGVPLNQPRNLYLAYHEGRTGYQRKNYSRKPDIVKLADRVQNRAFRYDNQLKTCEQEFQCWRFYQFWPFCGDW